MNNSKEYFIKLINDYLDEDLSPEEFMRISKLIAENETFANMFCEYKSIHIATAKYYNHKINLQKLPKYRAKRPSVFMGNLEWAAVLALVFACLFLLKKDIIDSSKQYMRNIADNTFAGDSLSLSVRDFFDGSHSFYSLLDFKEE